MKLAAALGALALAGCTTATVIRSYPPGAEVFVDGRSVGYTPAVYSDSASPGTRHLVTLYRAGYAPLTAEIAASRPSWAKLVFGSLFVWPLLFSSASYPETYDFPLTSNTAVELRR